MSVSLCFLPSLLLAEAFDDIVGRGDAEFAGLAQVGYALLFVSQVDLRQSPVVVGFGKFGIEGDGLVVVDQGGAVVVQARQQVGTVVVGIDEVGGQGDDLVEVGAHEVVVDGFAASFGRRLDSFLDVLFAFGRAYSSFL